MEWKCPNCGAQTSGDACEYCGTAKLNRVLFQISCQNKEDYNVDESILDYVAPFKCNSRKALKANKFIFKKTLSPFFKGEEFRNIKTTSYYVPVVLYEKFDEPVIYAYLCDSTKLPSVFPSIGIRPNRAIPKKHELIHSYKKDEQSEALTHADILLEATSSVADNELNLGQYIKPGYFAYLPFWVIEGKYREYNFSTLIFGGCSNDAIYKSWQINFIMSAPNGKRITLSELSREFNSIIKSEKANVSDTDIVSSNTN